MSFIPISFNSNISKPLHRYILCHKNGFYYTEDHGEAAAFMVLCVKGLCRYFVHKITFVIHFLDQEHFSVTKKEYFIFTLILFKGPHLHICFFLCFMFDLLLRIKKKKKKRTYLSIEFSVSHIYKARHAHKHLYTVLPKYSKIQVLPGITSCRLMKYNKQAIELDDLLKK